MENAIVGTIMDWEINSSGLTQKKSMLTELI